MGIGTGLGGSLGVAQETAYGTYVAPDHFYEVNKVDIKKVKNVAQGGGLAAGRMVQLGSRRVVTTEAAAGSVELEVANKGMGLWLKNIFGGTVSPVQQGASAAYLQTHSLVDNIGKSLTLQSGVPDTGGTVRPYTFKGGKVTGAEFSCSVDQMLMLNVDADFQKASEVETLVAPSYVAGVSPFHFGQLAVKVGATYGSESVVSGVKGFSLKVERGQATDRFYASAAGLKAEPLVNDYVKVSGSIDADFLDKTVFADRFAADTPTSLVLEFVGPLIASTYYQTFRLKVPMVFFDGDTPIIEGPDVVSGSFGFTAQFDSTNSPLIAEYVSTDTTI